MPLGFAKYMLNDVMHNPRGVHKQKNSVCVCVPFIMFMCTGIRMRTRMLHWQIYIVKHSLTNRKPRRNKSVLLCIKRVQQTSVKFYYPISIFDIFEVLRAVLFLQCISQQYQAQYISQHISSTM